MSRTVKQTIRLSAKEQAEIQRVAKERGYLSPTAFIRAATSPIRYLVQIDHIELLPQLVGRVLIPTVVAQELE
jgi:hypothetical protein